MALLRWLPLVLLLAGCDRNEQPAKPALLCVPGETRTCAGRSGCLGGQACNEDGSGYLPCDCGDAGAPPASPAPPSPPETRKAQCARLLDVMNAGNAELGKETGSPASNLRANAVALKAAAKKARALTFGDPAVVVLRDEYARFTESIAQASDTTAEALEGGQPADAMTAAAQLADYDKRETAFADLLTKICSNETPKTK